MLEYDKHGIFTACRSFFVPQGEKRPAKEEKHHAAAG
jgi:hypothetical protein